MRRKVKLIGLLLIALSALLLFNGMGAFAPAWQQLDAESALQEFSGDYYMGFFWSWHLSIRPDQTFVLEIFTDMLAHLVFTGSILVEGNRIQLVTSESNFYYPHELVAVRWGQRRYLVAADMTSAFCDGIQHGSEPRDEVAGGPFYLRDGDWDKPIGGFPILIDGHLMCP